MTRRELERDARTLRGPAAAPVGDDSQDREQGNGPQCGHGHNHDPVIALPAQHHVCGRGRPPSSGARGLCGLCVGGWTRPE